MEKHYNSRYYQNKRNKLHAFFIFIASFRQNVHLQCGSYVRLGSSERSTSIRAEDGRCTSGLLPNPKTRYLSEERK